MPELNILEVLSLGAVYTLAVLTTQSQYHSLFLVFAGVLALNFFCVSLAQSVKAGGKLTLPNSQDCLAIIVCSVVSVLVAYWTGL